MRVIGPDWKSTRALAEALQGIEGPDFRWGVGGVHGFQQLETLALADIPVPPHTNTYTQAMLWLHQGKQVWGRKNNHTQGRDIILPTHPRWRQRDYWVEQLSFQAEYRVHIFNNLSIRRGKKVQVEQGRFNPAVHSRRGGWHLDYSSKENPLGMRGLAKRAVAALGYLYGAVDILQDQEGKLWVLETNSAPALKDENTLASYVKAITLWATQHR